MTQEFLLPLSCPKCSARMILVQYNSTLKILKQRSWHVCKSCNFEGQSDDFKKQLLVA